MPPDTKFTISLNQAEGQYILNSLAKQPYGEVHLLISSIIQQFNDAEARANIPDPAMRKPAKAKKAPE